MADDVWGELSDRFVDAHYGSITGRARTHVIDGHLREHLPPPPGRVVDVGGGAGTQSIPLARRGYDVTILDSSPGMLAKAAEARRAEEPAVAARIDLVEGPGERAAELLGGQRFDAVLCHGVLMYLADAAPLVATLAGLGRPGAIVSIVAKNRAALAVKPAHNRNWRAALAAFDAEGEVNRLGLATRADTIEAIAGLLRGNDVDPVAWYGVRLFTDNWQGPEPDPEEVPDILAVESEASRRDPYRRLSRLFHLVGRRR